MTGIAVFLVVFGILIILSRGPLIVAPGRTRDLYLKLFLSERRMRNYGIIIGLVAALVAYTFMGVQGTAPLVVVAVSLLVVVIAACFLIPFPASANRLAMKVWSAFSPPVLRVIGLVSVLFGMWLVFFGFAL